MLTRLALVLLMAPQFIPRPVEDPSGRYFGLKQVGSDPYGYESVEFSLTSKATKVPVVWARRDQSGERERRELLFEDLKVDVDGLSAVVRGKRPASIPSKWKGKFVSKAPPANAKGAVVPGLLLDGDWFLQVGDLEDTL